MGLYNPHFPHIIGEEWVPIRNEDMQFSPAVSSVEMGYEFLHQNNTDTVSYGRYYIRKWPTRVPGASISLFLSQPFFVQLYDAGTEAETGPINVVRIPVSSGTLTNGSLVNAANVQSALASPVDGRKLILSATTTPIFSSVDLNFSASQYDQLLQNKRIVAVNVVYNATRATDPNTSFLTIYVDGGQNINYGNATFDDQGVCRLGDTNWWFSVTTPGLSFPSPFPFTPVSIRRFQGTHASPITVTFEVDSDEAAVEAAQFDLLWAALDVYYCEEKRLAAGGSINLNQGVNAVPFFALPLETTSGYTLDNAKYTLTLAAADTGDSRGDFSQAALLAQPYPSLNALRQLYPTTYHRGVQINHPSPVGLNILDKTFTKEETSVLPQITLHQSSGTPDVIGDVHPYGHQVAAQVYGTVIAEQTIEDSNIGSVDTQQVRWYARRFGNTSTRLDLVRTTAPNTVIASLTPAEFDELEPADGIIDGWKEVTLDLDVPQSFTGTRPTFRWTAANESVGDRWEILAMLAAAISGTPLNTYTPAPSNYNLGVATYGWPMSGASDALRWLQVPPSQGVSAVPASVDQSADAVLMFAVTPIPVTGFAISELTQALTGIATDDCGGDQCCIPTGIQYHRLEWDMGVVDTFTRSAMSGWGTADTGDAWTIHTGVTGDFSVNGSEGLIMMPAAGVSNFVTQPKPLTDVEVAVTLWTDMPISGASAAVSLLARFSDVSNFYRARAHLNTNGLVSLFIDKNVGGSTTNLVTYDNIMHLGMQHRLRLIFNVTNRMLKLTAQRLDVNGDVVETVTIYATDVSITTAGFTGIQMTTDTLTVRQTVYFDDYCAYPSSLGDGGFYEIQRMDELTDWQTIMRGSPCSWYMNDYESRVGIESTYRIRIVDMLNFNGPWSNEIANTLTSPGVTGGSCLDGNGTLIFTSNYAQNGIYNLAYTEVFERSGISEDFVFPEANTPQLQRAYQRDYPIAFKGTERGGTQFARALLIHNTAIDPLRLADMQELRDMAWAQLPYVCVRDEIGDRWYALVTVPNGSVRRNRQLYLANITVSEVTDTPFPIDPVANA